MQFVYASYSFSFFLPLWLNISPLTISGNHVLDKGWECVSSVTLLKAVIEGMRFPQNLTPCPCPLSRFCSFFGAIPEQSKNSTRYFANRQVKLG